MPPRRLDECVDVLAASQRAEFAELDIEQGCQLDVANTLAHVPDEPCHGLRIDARHFDVLAPGLRPLQPQDDPERLVVVAAQVARVAQREIAERDVILPDLPCEPDCPPSDDAPDRLLHRHVLARGQPDPEFP